MNMYIKTRSTNSLSAIQNIKNVRTNNNNNNNKVPSPLVTSHLLTSLYAASISGGQQSQLKLVELFTRGDHGCYAAIATGKHSQVCTEAVHSVASHMSGGFYFR